jgi:hypothetical protein
MEWCEYLVIMSMDHQHIVLYCEATRIALGIAGTETEGTRTKDNMKD